MATLKERDQQVLRLRFGWDGEKPMHLRAVGVLLGISAEAVRQIQLEAVAKLKLRVSDELREFLQSA